MTKNGRCSREGNGPRPAAGRGSIPAGAGNGAGAAARRPGGRGLLWAAALGLAAALGPARAADEEAGVRYLSDMARETPLVYRQAWGTLGLDTAAVPPDGRAPTPIILGQRTYARGLGHHAGGEIVVPVQPSFVRFRTEVGVQWQGGGRGSVVMQVWVDGVKQFDSGVRSDSDPPLPVDIPLAGARELRLTADDNGDGIGCDMATWAEARFVLDSTAPSFGAPQATLAGRPAARTAAASGFSVALAGEGPQIAFLEPAAAMVAAVDPGEDAAVSIPVRCGSALRVRAEVRLTAGESAEAALEWDGRNATRRVAGPETVRLDLELPPAPEGASLTLRTRGVGPGPAAVRWGEVCVLSGTGSPWRLPLAPPPPADGVPPMVSALRPALEDQLLEWDWRLQDGIGTPRAASDWPAATARVLERGLRQLDHLRRHGRPVEPWQSQAEALQAEKGRLDAEAAPAGHAWEDLWRRAHRWRRDLLLRGAWGEPSPIVFVKQLPSIFSHQLTQYYGGCARPGGGVCVLDAPGVSLAARVLAPDALPPGSFQHVDVSADGRRLLFAYCHAETPPPNREVCLDRVYHLYEMGADGAGLRQLTDGPWDDFCPRYLPDGRIVFLSTRRGGYHRCGRGPCPVYTLALAEADGSNPRTISFHETHEWDPSVMADGRIVYTRWDYVDRSAVYYQQLWSVRPDGSDVRILFGNNTFNPVGIWEARAIPGSRRLMATAAAHHAMTAGSIILLDPAVGVDGSEPIARLTPEVLFPESEAPVAPTGWHGALGVSAPPPVPEEQRRWPGHCYRSPYPLSETLFLAAYSYDALIGEPSMNPANMFGLYLVDAFGNRELLHRDPNISSQWPVLLRPRDPGVCLPSLADERRGRPAGESGAAPSTAPREGIFILTDAYAADPPLPPGVRIRGLRVLQVLPKSTPHANTPPVGAANASPGKQVLGTVPVEEDGSACFRAPACVALAFQVLDEQGQAVQTMRSLTYLQPGETTGCAGCHEPRLRAPSARKTILALRRPPSTIEPGPEGSSPLSFPLLVQPVLDQNCVRCHAGESPAGGVALTGDPEGHYTRSYNALVRRVPFSAWGNGDFYPNNAEPLTRPDQFGARASPLMKKLAAGHKGVQLSREDLSRLVTWMDANALFYGTFNPADQERQRRGERIAGPDVQ